MAAATAVNAQLRADETKMKHHQREDVLQELLRRIKEEKAQLAELGIEPFGFERVGRGGTPEVAWRDRPKAVSCRGAI